jgi:hypothetical protein
MQATGGDNGSECIPELGGSAARERKAEPSGISARPPEHNDAAVHNVHILDQRRIEALKALDERSFSCVASLSCLSLAHRAMQQISF